MIHSPMRILLAILLSIPVFASGQNFQQFIDGGNDHSIALRCDGTIRTWGKNDNGQLGIGAFGAGSPIAVQVVDTDGVGFITNAIAVAAGAFHSLAILGDGTVITWGDNSRGQIGNGTIVDRNRPTVVNGLPLPAIAIAGGLGNTSGGGFEGLHSVAVLTDGSVWAWGANENGQLGDNSTIDRLAPVQVRGVGNIGFLANVVDVKAGRTHTIALVNDGTVRAWGNDGLLGDNGISGGSSVPVEVCNTFGEGGCAAGPLDSVTAIACHGRHSLALLFDGTMVSWGTSGDQLGDCIGAGDVPDRVAGPGCVGLLDNVVAIAAGEFYSLAIRGDSSVWTWGSDAVTQLGNGLPNDGGTSPFPVQVCASIPEGSCGGGSLDSIIAIGAGKDHALSLHADMSLNAWGSDFDGQLGNGGNPGSNVPDDVIGVSLNVQMVVADAGTDATYCAGDSVQIGAAPNAGFDYSWTPVTGLSDPNISNPYVNLNPTSSVTLEYILEKTYSVGSTIGACIIPDTVEVTVIGAVANMTSSAPACVGDSVNFYSVASAPGLLYDWDFGAGSIATLAQDTSANPEGVTYATSGAKTVTLTLASPSGCAATGSLVITINPIPSAAFSSTASTISKCAGDTVSFTNLGTGGPGVSHTWDFGLLGFPASSNIENPAPVIYLANAPITATHTVTNQFGCMASDTVNFTINEMPTADFSTNAPSCTGSGVDFVNTGTTGATYFWNFGSGAIPATSIVENPTGVTYSTLGGDIKTVYLITTLGGCADSMAQTINVFETPAPSFTSTGTTMSKCEEDTVSFNYTGTTGTGWTYDWDFGVVAFPSSSNAQNPSEVIYFGATTKTVTLTVTNGACSDTTSVSFAVNQMPVANFSTNAPSCTGDSVYFINTGTSGASGYAWNFGGGSTPGTSSLENPAVVIYDTTGGDIKTITLLTTMGTCTDSISKTINITETPAPAFTHDAAPNACEGATVTFVYTGTTDPGWTYAWDFGAGATPPTSTGEDSIQVVYTGPGAKTVNLTVTGTCSQSTISSTIVIVQTPGAGFSSTAPSCTMDSVDFMNTGTTGATYAWTFGSGSAPATSAVENPIDVIYSSEGIKSVTLVTTLGTCVDSSTQTINLTETPVPLFTNNSPQCEGDSVSFVYTGTSGLGWTYAWDFGLGASPATSPADSAATTMYTGAGNKTVTLTVTNNTCSGIAIDNTVSVNATPVASFTSTTPSCTGDAVGFANTGTSGAAYSWNLGTGSAPPTSSAVNPTGVTYSGAGLIAVELVTTLGTCTDTSTMTINIVETPLPLFSDNGPKCEGEEFTFTYGGTTGTGWTYAWDFGAGSNPNTSTAEFTATTTYTGPGSKTVSLTVTNDICSNTVMSSTTTVNESPIASFTSTAPSCTGDSVDFTNTGSTGVAWAYSWTFDAGSNPATSTDESPIDIIYSTDGTKLVRLIVGNTTCSDTAIVPININLRPTANFLHTGPQCAGVPVNFINTGSSGSQWTYAWDFGAGAITPGSNAENPTGIAYGYGGSKSVSFTISDQFCSETIVDTFSIYSLPIVQPGPDTTICADQSVQIGGPNVVGTSYNWFPSVTLDNPLISNPTASPSAPVTAYIVTITDANGCTHEDSILVTMLGSALVDAGNDVEICWGDSVQLGLGMLEGQTYSWTPSSNLDNSGLANPLANPTGTTTYTVSVSFENCPPITDDVLVLVHQLPKADATDYLLQDSVSIILGASVQLLATGGMQYVWTPETGLSNPGLYNPIASPDSTTNYVVTVTDIFGCVNRDTIRVKVDSIDFFVPTAFTPDGNGFNDLFYIRIDEVEEFELILFDRWGEQIFISRSVDIGWNGRNAFNQNMPQGAYVYSFIATLKDGETINNSGLINLIR